MSYSECWWCVRERRQGVQDCCVTNNLDALLTALYVKIDAEIGGTRWLGRPPRLTDSELVCLAVAQALLGFTSESRRLRFADCRLGGMFPCVPGQPGWNKRLRAALPLVKREYGCSPSTRTSGSTTTGSSTPRRWNAAARVRR